jgi:hypothetical protein
MAPVWRQGQHRANQSIAPGEKKKTACKNANLNPPWSENTCPAKTADLCHRKKEGPPSSKTRPLRRRRLALEQAGLVGLVEVFSPYAQDAQGHKIYERPNTMKYEPESDDPITRHSMRRLISTTKRRLN